jgi:A/G-specific adenine glycosylase
MAATTDRRLARALLGWYDRHARALPWRAPPGARPPPAYAVWLSEVMLQQTTVAAVAPRFRRFLARWPDVQSLAAASLEDVLAEWAGLGYYARARNLHACARAVARRGGFPNDEAGLRALPGIGAYTAAAIAAIAFGRRAAAVDGNVERVISRLDALDVPPEAAKPAIRGRVEGLVPATRPGDFAQALMDLGATICTPRAPKCLICPWRGACRAFASGAPENWPLRAPKRSRGSRRGVAFVLTRGDGAVWLTRRAENGLLGGMRQVPTTDWTEAEPGAAAIRTASPMPRARWRTLPEPVRHGFTHLELALEIRVARVANGAAPRGAGAWFAPEELGAAGLPTLMRKVLAAALAAG